MAWAIIYLGPTLPPGSSSLPGAQGGRAVPRSFDLAPAWPCSRWGLPGRRHCCLRRWSLTPPFHPHSGHGTLCPERFFSVALSAGRPARVLPGTVLCGARTFLRRPLSSAIARPTLRPETIIARTGDRRQLALTRLPRNSSRRPSPHRVLPDWTGLEGKDHIMCNFPRCRAI